MNNQDETNCLFVSTYGLMKSCDIHPEYNLQGNISYDKFTTNISYGTTVYMHFDMIEHFINNFLYLMKNPFVLVSGSSDHSCPIDFHSFEKLLESEKLIVWYSQNVVKKHPKIKHLPIGLDYHTLSFNRGKHEWCDTITPITPLYQENTIKQVRKTLIPLSETIPNITADFHNSMGPPIKRTLIRTSVYEKLKNKNFVTWLDKCTREEFWKKINNNAFVACVKGNGECTHRFWETVILGRIPVVERSISNGEFEGLPVLIIDDWNDINEKFLKEELSKILIKINNKEYKMEIVLLNYWKNIINSYKKN